MYSMGALSLSPSPITMVPSMPIVSKVARMLSTAARSAPSASPIPIVRADAIAACSTTRSTSSERSNMVQCFLLMDNITILVLSDPTDRDLAMLEALPNSTSIAVGNNAAAFENLAPEAKVILNWSGGRQLMQQVWKMAPRVEWVHSRAAGLDSLLFPELVDSPVPLTNGRGVFSQSLGEFVIGAALFFAKDFRRMLRNQAAGIWGQFDVEEVRGQTMGIVGYGDIGRACAERAHAMGMKVLALRRRPDLSKGDRFVDRVYGFEGLLEMLPQCDYVVAAAPLTQETRHLIGDAAIAAMKKTAVVMNVGRG